MDYVIDIRRPTLSPAHYYRGPVNHSNPAVKHLLSVLYHKPTLAPTRPPTGLATLLREWYLIFVGVHAEPGDVCAARDHSLLNLEHHLDA